MLRLLVFFVAVMFLTRVLAQLPVVGLAFQIPFLGFWFTAILLSAFFAKLGADAVDVRARRSLERSLGSVDTPHHRGKLGALLLSQGRAKKAIALFEQAVERDPNTLEWRYGLGQARLAAGGDPGRALDDLDQVIAVDEEHAFGSVMLLSARAARQCGEMESALVRLERFERNHGPSPESALLRGRLLKSLDRAGDATLAFDAVAGLAGVSSRQSPSRSWTWRLRAFLARVFG